MAGGLDPAKLLKAFDGNFPWYCQGVLKIATKGGEIQPFNLNEEQHYLHQRAQDQLARQGYVRMLILKARQWGGSTYCEARGYGMTSRRENQTGLVMAHRDDSSNNLFRMIQRFHEHDFVYAPQTKASNAKELVFSVPYNSRYMVHTAGKTSSAGVGRSFSYRFVHCSEVAWWGEMGAHTMGGLLEAVPSEHPAILGTEVFWETTANGYDPLFYAKWDEVTAMQERGEPSEWELVFIPWYWHKAYALEMDEDQRSYVLSTLSDYEKWLLRQERRDGTRVTTGQLAWRRQKISSGTPPPGLTKQQFFKQEYPATAIEAFQATGSHIFDLEKVEQYRQVAPDPIRRYDFLPESGEPIYNEDGQLKVWAEPDPMRCYIIGADVAEGLEHGDWSSADIIDHHNGEVVAKWHGHIHPADYGQLLAHIGRRYNQAWIGVERNNHGLTTITRLHDVEYKRLYVEQAVDVPGAKPRKRYGWVTSKKTKPMMVDTLIKVVEEEPESVRDKDTWGEMLRFERHDDGTYGAQEGHNDDRLMSLAIARELRRVLPTPKQQAVRSRATSNRKVGPPPTPGRKQSAGRSWKGHV